MIFAIIILGIGLIFQLLKCLFEYKNNSVLKLIMKSIASVSFFVAGIISFLYSGSNKEYSIILFSLGFGMIGDVVLDIKYIYPKHENIIFIMGMASFFIGHILYLIFLINRTNNILISIVISLILSLITLYFIYKNVIASKSLLITGGIYITIILFLLTLSIIHGIEHVNTFSIMFMIAIILFVSSDLILAFNEFSGNRRLSLVVLNLLLYYIAQATIALSICFI